MKKFVLEKYNLWDKTIVINGPGKDYFTSLHLYVDHDDVHHEVIEKQVELLIDILNNNADAFYALADYPKEE